MAKETYTYGKRDLHIWQKKRPTHMAKKETYTYGKKRPEYCASDPREYGATAQV